MATLTETDIAESRRAFESCDLNGDGFMDPDEFHALLEKLDGDVSRAECLLDFEIADTGGDGYMGLKEFVIWWTTSDRAYLVHLAQGPRAPAKLRTSLPTGDGNIRLDECCRASFQP